MIQVYVVSVLTEFTAFTAEASSAIKPLFGGSTLQIDRSWNRQQVSQHLGGDGSIYTNWIKALTSGFSFPLVEIELTLALLQNIRMKMMANKEWLQAHII